MRKTSEKPNSRNQSDSSKQVAETVKGKKIEKPQKVEKTEKVEKAKKVEKTEKVEKAKKVEKTKKDEKTDENIVKKKVTKKPVESESESDENMESVEEIKIPVNKSKKVTASVKTADKKSSLRDLDKIVDDPDKYARSVTVERLVTILQKMSDYYYNEPRPLVDDDVFDTMNDVLKKRDPNNAFLFQTGVTEATEKDVQLPYSMPSLEKIKPGEKSLTSWFKKYNGPYMVMDKLDGISVQIYKDSKGHVNLYTKKQTSMGTIKNHMLKYLVNDKALANLPNNTSIRGEVVISKKDFEDVSKQIPDLKNERVTMSALMNTDRIDSRISKKAQMVVYNILYPRYTMDEQIKKLEKWGFKTVWHKQYTISDLNDSENNDNDDFATNEENDNEEEDDEEDEEDEEDEDDGENKAIVKLSKTELSLQQILLDRIETSEFLIDGLVVADDSKIYEHTEDKPKYSMAFKMNQDIKDAVVEEVIWDPTMYSYLKPVIRIKPITFPGNVTVTYATGHNAKNIYNNNIGKGATIKIVRSGNVIPYVIKVDTPASKPDMPDMEYEWTDEGKKVDIMVVNPSDEISRKIQIKRNLHFFRKLKVKFLSEGIITKIYDGGYTTVKSIVKCASTKNTKLYKIPGLGEKMVTKIYDQIDKAFNRVKLFDLMAGSLIFGRGLGVRKIKAILKKYPNVLNMVSDNDSVIKQNILQVAGFSDILATKFADNLKSFGDFLTELKSVSKYNLTFEPQQAPQPSQSPQPEQTPIDDKSKKGKNKNNKQKSPTKDKNNEQKSLAKAKDNNLMTNQKILMTGFRSDAILEFIENNGGEIASGVSKNTTLVIYDTSKKGDTSKLNRARDLGIQTMTRQEFENKYNI
jgi:DNA ligase (NAD+)